MNLTVQKYSKINKSSRKTRLAAADKWFSIYIRLRDSKQGVIRCITCNSIKSWRNIDCGHYQKRSKMSTRYDEENCHAQCRACNQYHSGRDDIFARNIDLKCGADTAETLRIKAKKLKKYTNIELYLIEQEYREKALKLAESIGIEL